MRYLTGSRLANSVVLMALLALPLIYAGLLTTTYTDPTNRLESIRAAVVNLDAPATATSPDGQERSFTLGRELTDTLTSGEVEGAFTFVEMDAGRAAQAMRDEDVRAILTIPANLSSNAAHMASGATTGFERSTLTLETDDGINYVTGTLANAISAVLSERLSAAGAENYIDGVLISLGTIGSGLADAATGASELAAGNAQLRDGLGEANDGAAQLASGADRLAGGLSQAATGAGTLFAGASELAGNLTDAQPGASQLAGGAGQLSSGLQSAKSGAAALSSNSALLAGGLREADGGASQLSGGLTQLQGAVDQYTGGVDKLRGVVTTPAAGGMDLGASAAALAAGTDSYTHQVEAALQRAGQAASLLPELQQGTRGLADGAASAAEGALGLHTGVENYSNAVDQAAAQCALAHGEADPICQALAATAANSQQLREAAKGLRDGTDLLSTGTSELAGRVDAAAPTPGTGDDAAKLAQLATAGEQLRTGSAALSGAIGSSTDSAEQNTIVGALNSLSANSQPLREATARAAGGAQQLSAGLAGAAGGSDRLAAGAAALSEGVTGAADSSAALSAGVTTLADGVSRAAQGSTRLAAGAGDLSGGIDTAAQGSELLSTNTAALAGGLDQAAGASELLAAGSGELAGALGEASDKVPVFANSRAAASVAAQPVSVTPLRNNAVSNNGAGFAPMFLSLSLFIGTMGIFMLLPGLDRRRASEAWWLAALRPAWRANALAALQGLVVAVLLGWVAGFHIERPLLFLALSVAGSVSFTLFNQGMLSAFAFRGRFVSVVFLALNVATMGGTFPIETSPAFFRWLHPLMPASHLAMAFREAIAGASATGAVGAAFASLSFWGGLGAAVLLLGAYLRRKPQPLPADVTQMVLRQGATA